MVFALVCFIYEVLKQKKFHAGDLLTVYQSLLTVKPTTKPPAMSINEIERAINWLVAPSRKKMWLRDMGDDTFEISSNGMLHMTYEHEPETTKGKK